MRPRSYYFLTLIANILLSNLGLQFITYDIGGWRWLAWALYIVPVICVACLILYIASAIKNKRYLFRSNLSDQRLLKFQSIQLLTWLLIGFKTNQFPLFLFAGVAYFVYAIALP